VSLEKFLAAERTQLKAMTAASFAKDTQIEELKTQFENAKTQLENADALKIAVLETLHGEGTTVIDELRKQLDQEQKARQILNDTLSVLRERASNLEQERNLHKWAAQAGPINNPTIIENATLRQEVVELQRRLVDMEAQARRKISDLIANETSANSQIVALTSSLTTKDQLIASLNSKPKPPTPSTATVPKHIYDALTKENDRNRSELRRLNDWKSKTQPQQNLIPASELQAEQLRRVQAEDRYNKLFPRIATLEKQLLAAKDELVLNRNAAAPVSPIETHNLQQLIKLNGKLNADILRNNAKATAQLADMASDRDGLLQMLSERQREGGNNELANATAALRVQAGIIVELQKWKDEHEFMVEQADRMAAAAREIAKQQGDVDKARQQSMDAGFGSRGTVRKERERVEGEKDSPPRKGSKQPRVEDGEEDLFGDE
jgi:hypothetical protein